MPLEPGNLPCVPEELNHLSLKRWISTEIEINAPCAVVWKVLTDFPCYASWNPFIRRIGGELIVGGRLRVLARLPCGLPIILWPRVLEFCVEREIRWLGNLLVSNILEGKHIFLMEPLGKSRVRFIQQEEYSGMLLPSIWIWLKSQGLEAFRRMNRSLKVAAERMHESSR